MDKIIPRIDTALRWSFYALFFLVPIVMWPDTFELFEFNKMWTVFGISIFIFFLWVSKMVLQGKFFIRQTPLDIPIGLFLASQVISTIVSIDPHVSLWGYYSRFNGGLFSIVTYIFLYYAFATNLIDSGKEAKYSLRLLVVSVLSGIFVAFWGLPSHFGADPTCFVFRGTFDVSCWTDQFQPTVRVFSTLGQPNWMGAFLGALIPITLGFGFFKLKEHPRKLFLPIFYLGTAALFYICVLWTRSQSSFIGLVIGLVIFFVVILLQYKKEFTKYRAKSHAGRFLAAMIVILALSTFIIGTPLLSFNKYFTTEVFKNVQSANKPLQTSSAPQTEAGGLANSTNNVTLGGITESSKIRQIVWKGAIELFKQHPLFGTGVETYAYAYYRVKPVEHNLTSEWDYLYNKAHNEYLNYLATTGAFGLGSYLLIILLFFYHAARLIMKNLEDNKTVIGAGIIGGYVSILISNFFGFSVVPINLLFFVFPILFFGLMHEFKIAAQNEKAGRVGMGKMSIILVVGILAIYLEIYLLNFWLADRNYALGYNLDKQNEYSKAYTPLTDAVKMLPGEDLYKDELSINLATLAVLLNENKHPDEAAQFVKQAQDLSDHNIQAHPKNIVFYKTRIRVEYALAQVDPKYLDAAIDSARFARTLAPTDAKLAYNLALFYSQKGDNETMIDYLNEATKLKPNYVDAFYARALLYSELAKKDPSKAAEYKQKSRDDLNYILTRIDPNHEATKKLLQTL